MQIAASTNTGTHVIQIYERFRRAENHGKATVAVARHLAEASWWMLTQKQTYRRPGPALRTFVRYPVTAEVVIGSLGCACDYENRDEAMLMLLKRRIDD